VIHRGREWLLTKALGPVTRPPIDFQTMRRGPKPNQYLVCPLDVCTAKPDRVSPVYPVPVSVLRDHWMAMIARQPRVEQLTVDPDAWQYDFVQRSRLFGFPDTITVRFIPLANDPSTLAIYSRSHYGYADLGVNRRRITAWLSDLDTSLQALRQP
jgi:uncharacterized protein (DUF1499 family)